LGVDLGTSFTGAAVSQGGQSRMVPLSEHSVLMQTIVQVAADGTLSAGGTAEDDVTRVGRDFKRRLGDPTPLVIGGQPHSAVSLLAATLTSVLETVTALEGAAPDHVVLSYPAVWGPYRHEQFAEVPRRAGLDEATVTLVTEPAAAAGQYAESQHLGQGDVVAVYDLGGGTFDTTVTLVTEPAAAAGQYAESQHLGQGDVVAVYDLGGGTFDTTVTRVTATGTEILGIPEGLEWVGGVDFDEAVLAHLDQATGGALSALDPRDPVSAALLQRVRNECIRAKEALSRETSTILAVPLPGRPVDVRLTRGQFEDMIRTPLESTLAAVRRCLTSAGVSPADLAGVLLAGGSSRIPLVARMLGDDLGRPVVLGPHPQHCVALGAAALADPSSRAGMAAAQALAPVVPVARRRRPWVKDRRRRLTAVTIGLAIVVAAPTSALVWPSGTGSVEDDGGSAQNQIVATPTPTATAAVATAETAIGSPAATASPTHTPTPTHTPSASKKPTPTSTPTPKQTKPVVKPITGTGRLVGLAGKCMDVANAIDAVGTRVQLFQCNGTGAQVWTAQTDGTLSAYGKCLDVTAAGTASPIELNTCNGAVSQTWQLISGAIVNPSSKLCLEVRGNATADMTPLVTAVCSGGAGQSWNLDPG
jgi:actin-like ATPase involved in cell morphogenesis